MAEYTLEEAIQYHLRALRRSGLSWRDPRLERHRLAVMNLIRLRRAIRRGEAA